MFESHVKEASFKQLLETTQTAWQRESVPGRGTSVSCICWEWEVGRYQPLNEVGRMESGGQGRKVIRNTVIKTFIAKDIVLLEVNFDLYNMFLSKSEL